ncbi:MAG TPA: alpha/beta hydrolase [Sphingomicrobium sp.]|nr:alpha/beta hydrolase [Sphingomicrobium sp.]
MEYPGKILLLSAGMLVASAAIAQRERLPAECRQQIAEHCRAEGGGLRQCLRTALPKLSENCRSVLSDRSASRAAAPPGAREYFYGVDPKQNLDLVVPAGATKAPILVFIHGGGWAIGDKRHSAAPKAAHFTANGWAFASLNYRLVPKATVEQQAADIAAGLAWLRRNAAAKGLDGDRIILMGHSAGAHLAALVGTDPAYLAAAGVPMSAIDGIILLDGAGYDIAQQMSRPGNPVSGMYDAAFGRDPARQRALSPSRHAAAPNAPNWLVLPVARRADSTAQSHSLAAALNRAGASATVVPVPGESHGSLNKGLGEQGDFATAEVDRFLATLR